MLDVLCYRAYGTLAGTVEAVLDANPGLAARRQPYAAGVAIFLPDLAPARDEPIQLWM